MIAVAIAAAPVSTSFAETKTLQDFKISCETMKQRGQVQDLNLELKCSAKFTEWKAVPSQASLDTGYILMATASGKDGRWGTAPMSFNMTSAAQSGVCHDLIKNVVSSPKLVVKISSCDDLTAEKIQSLCEAKASQYCKDNKESSSESSTSKGPDTLCMVQEVGRSSTCDAYL